MSECDQSSPCTSVSSVEAVVVNCSLFSLRRPVPSMVGSTIDTHLLPPKMACHQAHNIPWATLASHFKYRDCIRGLEGRKNLAPQFKVNQGKEIEFFIRAFAQNIASHTDIEQSNFSNTDEPLDPETTVITKTIRERIAPSLQHTTKDLNHYDLPQLQKSSEDLLLEFSKMKAFLYPKGLQRHSPPSAWVSLEIIKLLIIYGEMKALHQICTHPDAPWAEFYDMHWDSYGDQNSCGWAYVPRLALTSYICLNLLLCYPPLWDDESGRSDRSDYRDTACYQRMLRTCTLSHLQNNIAALPHRQFYGISEDQFSTFSYEVKIRHAHVLATYPPDAGYPYGLLPILDFLTLHTETSPYLPTGSDVMQVRKYLYKKGLPLELVYDIMDFAGYAPLRKLERAHDPFHPTNRDDLHRYLDYCWRIVVRCDLMARWLGDHIHWDRLVGEILVELISNGKSKGPAKHGRFFFKQSYDPESSSRGCHENTISHFL